VDTVARPAVIIGEGRPGPGDPVLVQVSRWDRLKDMAGVMEGFAEHTAPAGPGHLVLVAAPDENRARGRIDRHVQTVLRTVVDDDVRYDWVTDRSRPSS